MPIAISDAGAAFEGDCTVEEALALNEYLSAHPQPRVDFAGCTYVHTALLQLLMRAKPYVVTPPVEPRLAQMLQPLLRGDGAWITR